ncbi:MAG: hypothetical protein ABFD69_14100 [Candidatus Sumerlaeia bacterium]
MNNYVRKVKKAFWLINLYRLDRAYRRFLNTNLNQCVRLNIEENPAAAAIDLVSVTFNCIHTVRQQIRLTRKYLEDSFCLTITDNSTDRKCREEIRRLCEAEKIAYIGLPPNPYRKTKCSNSHGAALDWIWRNYLSARPTAHFGFLDHDIYPVRRTSIVKNLSGRKVHGALQVREQRWYLWAGFCFFERPAVQDVELSFRPIEDLDTGGRNFQTLYSRLQQSNLIFPAQQYHQLRDGDLKQADQFETLGDWIHTFNASQWIEVDDGKEKLVEKLLAKY